ncbi:hypothetical protein D8I24_0403 (plasmid) [Cupriavidus necator H850]|nr:hypothetical protein D8I24_0403 [Cupriavidus necator H850]
MVRRHFRFCFRQNPAAIRRRLRSAARLNLIQIAAFLEGEMPAPGLGELQIG